ncbi:metallophosphoesterase [Rhizobium ruizarguesonis]|uniref:metallophosphoesterase n=1 Tax=Rhizobium ruizarguesonis TaxID=2081791 RepID=UPI0013C8313D|nr:metallophosphoesterase [Rhizobium ruizarguesonis]NEH27446.1 phosphohydrolase [Rhizobium ruizarguesonis]
MRAWIISDIHHFGGLVGTTVKVPEADVCICAGDVSDDIKSSIQYLRQHIEPHMPVVLVLGNHDYFGSGIEFALQTARHEALGRRIFILEDEAIEMSGCRFVGATLWTNFAVSVGRDEHIPPEERRAFACRVVPAQMADFHRIFRSDERRYGENGMITVRELLARHKESRSFIDRELAKPFDGRTVVLTHHAPHMRSMDPRFFGEATSAAFVSDLSDLITRRRPSIWVHGHVHRFSDYMADRTRVICNPFGYGGERGISGFLPGFVIAV